MKQTFPKVWFATEKLFHSQTRLINLSDHGSLHFESGELQFISRKQSLKIKNIESIELVSPRIPWISLTLSMVVLLVFVGFILSRVPSDSIFTIIFMLMPFLSILLPFMIFAQKAILWIEIAFRDDENMLRRAYFLDGSRLILSTFGSMLDDTLKMYKEVRSNGLSAG